MARIARSSTQALIWEMWSRNRLSVSLVIGMTAFSALLNWVLPESISVRQANRFATGVPLLFLVLRHSMVFVAYLLVLSIFSYTEFNSQKDSMGFPHRLFTLPVTSLRLVALPVVLGVATVELFYLIWTQFILPGSFETADLVTTAILVGAYMVIYQSFLWMLPGLRSLRMLVLGAISVVFILSPLLTFMRFLSMGSLMGAVVVLATLAFLASWRSIERQRCGAGLSLRWLKDEAFRSLDLLPRRSKAFSSASAAQFWYEWRRSGLLLPLLVGGLLLVFIGPLSWSLRADPSSALRILVMTLAMPVILALPVGKGWSKPDFWSTDLSLPAFLAVRPLATEEMVVIKMKAAALSASISWALALAFLSLWLPLWANPKSLTLIRASVEQVFGHSVYRLYAIAVLSTLAGVLLTWRFLVGGFWIGLSGNRNLFTVSALPYGLAPLALIPFILVVRPDSPLRVWIRNDPERFLSLLEWIGIFVLVAKFSLAAFSWRKIAAQHIRQYLLIWAGGTLCLIALAVLLWSGVRNMLPLDIYRVRNILILLALLVIPFARLGLAPSFLAKNRHR